MVALRSLVLFFASVGLLNLTYPYDDYVNNSTLPWMSTLASYALVLGILTTASVFIAPWIVRRTRVAKSSGLSAALVTGGATFGLLLLVTMVFSGPGLFLNIPGTRVKGIFFAEWNFLNFLFYVALPISLIVSGLDAASWFWRNHTRK